MPTEAAGVSPWLSLEPGDLRHWITINQQSSTQDSFGQPIASRAGIRTCWGGINLVAMHEVFSANQLTSQSTDVWTVRWTSTVIQPGMQIVVGGSTYRVQAVSNPGKRKIYLHLLCLELNATSGS